MPTDTWSVYIQYVIDEYKVYKFHGGSAVNHKVGLIKCYYNCENESNVHENLIIQFMPMF